MPIFKKVLFSLFICLQLIIVSLSLLTNPVHAQSSATDTWYDPSFEGFVSKVFDSSNPNEIFGERYTYAQVAWILHSIRAFGYGKDINDCIQAGAGDLTKLGDCLTTNVPPPSKRSEKTGAIDAGPILGFAGAADALLGSRPASGVKYVADTLSRFQIIPSAYAQQGFGFNTLTPIQDLWKISRNATYFLAIVLTIALAFMIMFRVKLSPQTVISIQSALPKLFGMLILVTFSYAIAGFLIDLAYVIIGLLSLLISNSGISGYDPIQLFKTMSGLTDPLFSIFLGLLLVPIIITAIGAAGAIPAIPVTATLSFLLPVGGILILIIVIVAVIFIIRIFWLLLLTLIRILLLTVGAPIIILLGVVPGTGGFGGWVRSLLANVAVYPMVIILVMMSHFFFWKMFAIPLGIGKGVLDSFDTYNFSDGGGLVFSGNVTVPGLTGSVGIIGFLLSFGVLAIIPQAGNLMRSLVQGQAFSPTFGLPTPLGFALGTILGGAQRGGGQILTNLLVEEFDRLRGGRTERPTARQQESGQPAGGGRGPLGKGGV